jgi:hypothetical protein
VPLNDGTLEVRLYPPRINTGRPDQMQARVGLAPLLRIWPQGGHPERGRWGDVLHIECHVTKNASMEAGLLLNPCIAWPGERICSSAFSSIVCVWAGLTCDYRTGPGLAKCSFVQRPEILPVGLFFPPPILQNARETSRIVRARVHSAMRFPPLKA